MTMFQNLRPDCTLLGLVAFCVLSVFPQRSAQNPKQSMTDVCQNELHQRQQNALWRARWNVVLLAMFIANRKLTQWMVQSVACFR